MLKKDLEAKVERLEDAILELSQQKREVDKEYEKLTDESNDLRYTNDEFKRITADVTSVIDGIIAVKYPEEFHRFCMNEPSVRHMNDVPVGETLKDCPEEFRILFYIKSRFIPQPKIDFKF
jgi:regulator of replication initiation timing